MTVRAYIVDDSRTSRHLLSRMLHSDPGIEVVGEATDAETALSRLPRVRPDIVLMDVVMPGMGGLEATRILMRDQPMPIVLVSELVGARADLNFQALDLGALDLLRKPTLEQSRDPTQQRRFCRTIRMLSEIPVVGRAVTRRKERRNSLPGLGAQPTLLCIGASTGGPRALGVILGELGPSFPLPVVIVQHIAAGFGRGMADWLSDVTQVPVSVATDGETPEPGRAYLAPEARHLEMRGSTLHIGHGRPIGGYRPSVDRFFQTVAASPNGSSTLAVLLTGMGQDGAHGLLRLRRAGAWTAAQDERTSVVFGMPRAAVELNAAVEVLPVDRIAPRVRSFCSNPAPSRSKWSLLLGSISEST